MLLFLYYLLCLVLPLFCLSQVAMLSIDKAEGVLEKPRVFQKQIHYLCEVGVISAYTLPFPDPTCGNTLGMLVRSMIIIICH